MVLSFISFIFFLGTTLLNYDIWMYALKSVLFIRSCIYHFSIISIIYARPFFFLFFISSHSNFILMKEFLGLSRTVFFPFSFQLFSQFIHFIAILVVLIRPSGDNFSTLYLIIPLYFPCNSSTFFHWALSTNQKCSII